MFKSANSTPNKSNAFKDIYKLQSFVRNQNVPTRLFNAKYSIQQVYSGYSEHIYKSDKDNTVFRATRLISAKFLPLVRVLLAVLLSQ